MYRFHTLFRVLCIQWVRNVHTEYIIASCDTKQHKQSVLVLCSKSVCVATIMLMHKYFTTYLVLIDVFTWVCKQIQKSSLHFKHKKTGTVQVKGHRGHYKSRWDQKEQKIPNVSAC